MTPARSSKGKGEWENVESDAAIERAAYESIHPSIHPSIHSPLGSPPSVGDENVVPTAADVVQLLHSAKEMLPRIKETLEVRSGWRSETRLIDAMSAMLCFLFQIQRIKLEKIVTEAETEQRDRAERPLTTPERVLMSSQADNREERGQGSEE